MNNLGNGPMGGTWHSTYGISDRQKVIQILSTTLKEIQNGHYDEQKAATMAQEFEKYTFMKSASREEYLRMIKQKVTQLRSGLMNNPNAQMASNVGPPQNDMGLQNGNFYNQGRQQMSPMRNNLVPQQQQHQQHQQQQQQQQQPQQKQQSQPQQQQQQQPNRLSRSQPSASQSLQPTQQQIQQISFMIRTVPIPPALLAKVPNLPPNVNTWTQIYDCFQKKIIPASAMPIIKEIHNAHFQHALRQHQQQKLLQLQRMNNTAGNDGVGQLGGENNQSLGSAGNFSASMNNMGNMNNVSVMNNMGNMNMNTANNMGNMTNMGNMNNMGNISNAGNMANMGNMNNMNNMKMNNMNNLGGMNNMSMKNVNNSNNMANMGNVAGGMSNMGNMAMNDVNRQIPRNAMGAHGPQIQQQNGYVGVNKAQNSQNQQQQQQQQQQQPAGRVQMPQAKQQQQISTPASNQAIPVGQQQQAAKTPNIQITSQDLLKYNSDAMALLGRLQANGSISPNLDQAQKQNFVRKYIYHQKLSLWKAQQKASAINNPVNLPQSQPAPLQQAQVPPSSMGQGGFPQAPIQSQPQQQQQQQQPQQPQQLQQPQGQRRPRSSPVMQQPVPASAMNQQMYAQNMQQKSAPVQAANPVPQVRPAPLALAGGMPPLTDEMKMKLRSLFEEVSRNNVQLKDVTMLLSEKDKAQVKETMARISQQYANVDSVLSYFYVLTRNLEGTKRLIQMKHMTKSIMENLQRGIYLAGPDLLEKLRSQYQRYFEYVKEQITLSKQQQQQQQQQQHPPNRPQNEPIPQRMNQMGPQGHFPTNPPGVQHNVVPHSQPVFNAQGVSGQMGIPQSQQQQQQQQQHFARNSVSAPIPQQEWQNNSGTMASQNNPLASSPNMPQAGSPLQAPPQAVGKSGAKVPTKKNIAAGNRRRSTKGAGTPVAGAPTPASLANAIKTPHSISTPQMPPAQSNKGTPMGVSPNSEAKLAAQNEQMPFGGEMFGANGMDSDLMKRRELSKTNPKEFFFAALSNLLDISDDEQDKGSGGTSAGNGSTTELKALTQSPLSPSNTGRWNCDVKPHAIASAFCQVNVIKECSGPSILDECARIVELGASAPTKNGIKRERNEDDDIDLLFDEKKVKVEDSNNPSKRMYEPLEYDEWVTWFKGLQETRV
ncbi:Mediator complex subunit 15 family protein [Clavispora lusitaniae]|uniref:Mediator complex subunit 15 family protein n=1 Tax=Clavispora lusitaniae TaxID=36911 RepID=UPI00202C346D|nr:Mediator complex subunit 15 family protein [Clavispora lusitaniae]